MRDPNIADRRFMGWTTATCWTTIARRSAPIRSPGASIRPELTRPRTD